MPTFPPSVETLIDRFASLPGIGRKSAARLTFHILSCPPDEARAFADALTSAREGIMPCCDCQNLSEEELCPLCASTGRDRGLICVVADPADVAAIERCREYKGLYHVLHGVISPTRRKSPDDITLHSLLQRVERGGVREVILATNPDTDGDTTALYIARLLRPYEVKTTRLAYGLPMGGHVVYADEVTILRAIDGRQEL